MDRYDRNERDCVFFPGSCLSTRGGSLQSSLQIAPSNAIANDPRCFWENSVSDNHDRLSERRCAVSRMYDSSNCHKLSECEIQMLPEAFECDTLSDNTTCLRDSEHRAAPL